MMKALRAVFTLIVLLATGYASGDSPGGGLFNTASRTIRYGTADPAACTVSRGNIFYRTDLGQLKLCTATDTWTGVTTSGGTFLAGDGTAAIPSYSFASTGNGDNGMFLSAANALGFSTAGTERWVINASGALNPAASNTYDIGGSTTIRDIGIGRNAVFSGSTSGTVTVAAAAIAGTNTATFPAQTGNVVIDASYTWTTPAFNAANFAGGGTWTVDEADATTYAYIEIGKTMTVAWQIVNTDVNATTGLLLKIPNGRTAAKTMRNTYLYIDNGGALTAGAALVTAGGTNIELYKLPIAAWTNTTGDNTSLYGEITFEIQ